ncbi:hypothetical protein JCM10449v2_000662 [Rhodotorula kratochvilovae]
MATRTLQGKPRLLYSLPLNPPIAFPLHPTYPIQLPTRDLRQAYLDALWPPAALKQSELSTLEAFARLLLALLAERPPVELNTLVRELVLPLQEFDKRWRNQLPPLVEDLDDEDEHPPVGLSDDEVRRVQDDYARWAVVEKVRLEEERKKAEEKRRKGKERALDQDAPTEQRDDNDMDEVREVEVRPNDWLTAKELLETRLQALLLFTLLALPATFQPDKPKKGRKKKNPEHYPDTLDAAMLLDFLTDRMQIWRVMKDVSDLDFAVDVPLVEKEAKTQFAPAEERDAVQVWWADVVDSLFRTHVDGSILSHHRVKLFPAATTQADRLAQRLEPAPSPFKARSLLSLEKSARRRELREGERRVAESPTMKRLMSMSGLSSKGKEREGSAAPMGKGRAADDGDVFKMPSKPSRRQDGVDAGPSADGASTQDAASSSRPRLPRKQERPRPLPRGDSSVAGVSEALKRRCVSLGKKPSSSAVGTKKKGAAAKGKDEQEKDVDTHKRKRKSMSPKKLTASERAAHTLTLVPDTPDKANAAASSAASFRKPFSQTAALPSFAALGAAFRAGAGDAPPLPFHLPPPPRLPSDGMDWAGEGEDDDEDEGMMLDRRERGGRREEVGGASSPASVGAVTPKKQTVRQVLVPDT